MDTNHFLLNSSWRNKQFNKYIANPKLSSYHWYYLYLSLGFLNKLPHLIDILFICNAKVRSLRVLGLDAWIEGQNLKTSYTQHISFMWKWIDNGFISAVNLSSFHLLVIWEILFIHLVYLVIKTSKTFASNISQSSFSILSETSLTLSLFL